jgi:hypothetical protein
VFLRDRYDEKQQRAETCGKAYPPPWEVADRGWMARVYADTVTIGGNPDVTYVPVVVELEQSHDSGGAWLSEYLDHIADHDPARVIADLKAKRAIVDRCARAAAGGSGWLARGLAEELSATWRSVPRP